MRNRRRRTMKGGAFIPLVTAALGTAKELTQKNLDEVQKAAKTIKGLIHKEVNHNAERTKVRDAASLFIKSKSRVYTKPKYENALKIIEGFLQTKGPKPDFEYQKELDKLRRAVYPISPNSTNR